MDNGFTVHVGNPSEEEGANDQHSTYLALYTNDQMEVAKSGDHSQHANLNHLAVIVDNLDAVEQKIIAQGYKTLNHADYEPGRRFYFYLTEQIEIEVVSYSS